MFLSLLWFPYTYQKILIEFFRQFQNNIKQKWVLHCVTLGLKMTNSKNFSQFHNAFQKATTNRILPSLAKRSNRDCIYPPTWNKQKQIKYIKQFLGQWTSGNQRQWCWRDKKQTRWALWLFWPTALRQIRDGGTESRNVGRSQLSFCEAESQVTKAARITGQRSWG